MSDYNQLNTFLEEHRSCSLVVCKMQSVGKYATQKKTPPDVMPSGVWLCVLYLIKHIYYSTVPATI